MFSSFKLFSAKSLDMYRQLIETKFWYSVMVFSCYRHKFWASDRSQRKKSNFAGFLVTNLREKSADFTGVFRANLTKKQSVTMADFVVIFKANFARNRSVLR